LGSGSVINGNIGVTGSLAFAQPTGATVANVVTGNGAVSKSGAAILTLTAANTYSGGTTVSDGTLRPMTASFQGAPSASFTVYGVQPQRDGAVIGPGLETKLAAATSLYARYDGEIAGGDNAHAVTAGLRMSG
jgi:autotransporter-associated beta strand protein